MQATIEANRQYYDEKMMNLTEDLTEIIASMRDQIKISSPDKKDTTKAHDTTTLVPTNKKVHHWKVEIIQNILACVLSSIISAHQNSINSSSRHN